MSPLLLSASVQKQAEERFGEKWRAKSFPYLGNTVLITQLKLENEISELTDECDRFCKYVRHIIGAVVTVGVGQVCEEILGLAASYASAREAVSYRVIYGASRAINMKEIVPGKTGVPGPANDEDLSVLFKMIRMGSEKEVIKAAERYLKLTFSSARSLQQYHIDIMELITSLYRFSVNNEIRAEVFTYDMRELYRQVLDMDSDELERWLTDIRLSLWEELNRERNQSTGSFVSRAREYVFGNYADAGLSLDKICHALGVSNSHFSTVFKKKTGNSFVGYLTEYRLEQASRLLIETNEKSYIIAKKVGYTDPNYFSYVFKRRFGVSPSRYRTEYTEGEG